MSGLRAARSDDGIALVCKGREQILLLNFLQRYQLLGSSLLVDSCLSRRISREQVESWLQALG